MRGEVKVSIMGAIMAVLYESCDLLTGIYTYTQRVCCERNADHRGEEKKKDGRKTETEKVYTQNQDSIIAACTCELNP